MDELEECLDRMNELVGGYRAMGTPISAVDYTTLQRLIGMVDELNALVPKLRDKVIIPVVTQAWKPTAKGNKNG